MSILFAMLVAMQGAPDAQARFEAVGGLSRTWRTCTEREARTMAMRSGEAADVIARAAMAACSTDETALRLAIRSATLAVGQSAVDADGIVDRAKASQREKLLAIVIKAR